MSLRSSTAAALISAILMTNSAWAEPVGTVQTVASSSAPASAHQINLDLSSTNKTVSVGHVTASKPIDILVGNAHQIVSAGTLLTPAERLAVYQVMSSGHQSIQIGPQGNAVGGNLTIGPHFAQHVISLNIPSGVTVLAPASQNPIKLSGALVTEGMLVGLPSSRSNSLTISAGSISVLPGGSITTVVPPALSHLLGSLGSAQLNLNLSSLSNLSNAGTIAASGDLRLSAGGAIINAVPPGSSPNTPAPVISGAGGVTLVAGSGHFINSGMISSGNGNVSFNAAPGQDLILNNAGGRIIASLGTINLRDATFSATQLTSVVGGQLAARALNIYGGSGAVKIAVDSIAGPVRVLSACSADVAASGGTLDIGQLSVSGDPTISNPGGDVYLGDQTENPAGTITLHGQDLTILAGGDVLSSGSNGSINLIDLSNTSGGGGGNLTISAGLTPNLPNESPFCDVCLFGVAIDTHSSSANGGNVTITTQGNPGTTGIIEIGNTGKQFDINTSAGGAGKAGDVSVLASAAIANHPGAFIGSLNINASSVTGQGGNATFVAGFNFTTAGGTAPFTITGPSASGGDLFPGAANTPTIINTSTTSTTASAGSVLFAAHGGTVWGGNVGNLGNLTTTATSSRGGDINILSFGTASAAGSQALTFNTGSSQGTGGNVNIVSGLDFSQSTSGALLGPGQTTKFAINPVQPTNQPTGDISLNGPIITGSTSGTAGSVLLVAHGNINAPTITTSSTGGNSGSVSALSSLDFSSSSIDTHNESQSSANKGGDVNLLSGFTFAVSTVNGGNIVGPGLTPSFVANGLSATGHLIQAGSVDTHAAAAGTPGNVTMVADEGDVSWTSINASGHRLAGGSVNLVGTTVAFQFSLFEANGSIDTHSDTTSGGNINVFAGFALSPIMPSGGSPNLGVGIQPTFTLTGAGNAAGSVSVGKITAQGNSGSGGAVTIVAGPGPADAPGSVQISGTISTSSGSADGGDVSILSSGSVSGGGLINSSSTSGSTAGNVTAMSGSDSLPDSAANTVAPGATTLFTLTGNNSTGGDLNFGGTPIQAGSAVNGGGVTLIGQRGPSYTPGYRDFFSVLFSNIVTGGGSGRAGDVTVVGNQGVEMLGSQAFAIDTRSASGSGAGGDVKLVSGFDFGIPASAGTFGPGQVTLVELSAPDRVGGQVVITGAVAAAGGLGFNADILTDSFANGGNVLIAGHIGSNYISNYPSATPPSNILLTGQMDLHSVNGQGGNLVLLTNGWIDYEQVGGGTPRNFIDASSVNGQAGNIGFYSGFDFQNVATSSTVGAGPSNSPLFGSAASGSPSGAGSIDLSCSICGGPPPTYIKASSGNGPGGNITAVASGANMTSPVGLVLDFGGVSFGMPTNLGSGGLATVDVSSANGQGGNICLIGSGDVTLGDRLLQTVTAASGGSAAGGNMHMYAGLNTTMSGNVGISSSPTFVIAGPSVIGGNAAMGSGASMTVNLGSQTGNGGNLIMVAYGVNTTRNGNISFQGMPSVILSSAAAGSIPGNGGNLAFIASSSITAPSGSIDASSASGNGGQVTMLSGVAFNATGQTCCSASTTFTVTGGSRMFGSITDFASITNVPFVISTKSTAPANAANAALQFSGGSVYLAAIDTSFKQLAAGGGVSILGNIFTSSASGDGGSFTMVGSGNTYSSFPARGFFRGQLVTDGQLNAGAINLIQAVPAFPSSISITNGARTGQFTGFATEAYSGGLTVDAETFGSSTPHGFSAVGTTGGGGQINLLASGEIDLQGFFTTSGSITVQSTANSIFVTTPNCNNCFNSIFTAGVPGAIDPAQTVFNYSTPGGMLTVNGYQSILFPGSITFSALVTVDVTATKMTAYGGDISATVSSTDINDYLNCFSCQSAITFNDTFFFGPEHSTWVTYGGFIKVFAAIDGDTFASNGLTVANGYTPPISSSTGDTFVSRFVGTVTNTGHLVGSGGGIEFGAGVPFVNGQPSINNIKTFFSHYPPSGFVDTNHSVLDTGIGSTDNNLKTFDGPQTPAQAPSLGQVQTVIGAGGTFNAPALGNPGIDSSEAHVFGGILSFDDPSTKGTSLQFHNDFFAPLVQPGSSTSTSSTPTNTPPSGTTPTSTPEPAAAAEPPATVSPSTNPGKPPQSTILPTDATRGAQVSTPVSCPVCVPAQLLPPPPGLSTACGVGQPLAWIIATGNCQTIYVDQTQDSHMLAAGGTRIALRGTNSVAIRAGRLVALTGEKAVVIGTVRGDLSIPKHSAVIVEDVKPGVVRVANLSGDPVTMVVADGTGASKTFSAAKGQEVVIADNSLTDEELIPVDGGDREMISGSMVKIADARVLKRSFQPRQVVERDPLLNCSVCLQDKTNKLIHELKVRLAREGERDIREGKQVSEASPFRHTGEPCVPISDGEADWRPVAFVRPSDPVSAVLQVSTIKSSSAIIRHLGRVRLSLDKKGALKLDEGTTLIHCREQTLLQSGRCRVDLAAGTIVLVSRQSDLFKVQVLYDRHANSTRVSTGSGYVKLSTGQSAFYSPNESQLWQGLHTDSVARRSIKLIDLADGQGLALSEFSLVSALREEAIMEKLINSQELPERRLTAKLLKTAACLDQVTRSHGAYSVLSRNN